MLLILLSISSPVFVHLPQKLTSLCLWEGKVDKLARIPYSPWLEAAKALITGSKCRLPQGIMNCISSAGQADINNTEEEAKGTAKLLAWLPTGPSVYRHSNWVSNAYLTSYAALASPSVSVCFVTPETSPSAQTQHTHAHSHIHAYLCVNKWSAFSLLYNSLANKKVSGTFFAMLIVPEDWITNNGNDCWKLK